MGMGGTMPNAVVARATGAGLAVLLLAWSLTLSGPTNVQAGEGGFLGLGRRSDDEAQRKATIDAIRRQAIVVEKGTSASDAHQTALGELPLRRLSAANRRRADAVLANPSLFRKLPTIMVPADPKLYDYFVENPDVAVSIWRAMDISTFQMKAAGAGKYDAKVDDGTEGTVELLYRSPKEAVVLCNGTFKASPLVRAVNAQCILHLRTEYGHRRDGVTAVRHRVNMFVSFPSQSVETAAKLVSPISNVIIDRNFQELSLFLHMMTLLSEQRPASVVALSDRLDGVTDEQCESLRRVSATVHEQAVARTRQPAPVARGGEGMTRTARAND